MSMMYCLGVSNHEEYQSILDEFGGKLKILDQGKVKYFLKLHIAYDKHEGMCKISNISPFKFTPNSIWVFLDSAPPILYFSSKFSKIKGIDISTESKEVLAFEIRELLGKIGYLACTVRPDLLIVVSRLAPYMNKPGKIHWQQLQHCLKYLVGTKDDGLVLLVKEKVKKCITMHCDADWGGSKERKSTIGV